MERKNKEDYTPIISTGIEEDDNEVTLMMEETPNPHETQTSRTVIPKSGSITKLQFEPTISQTPIIEIVPLKKTQNFTETKLHEKSSTKEFSDIENSTAMRLVKYICDEYIGPCILFIFWVLLFGLSQLAWTRSLLGCEYDIVVCIKWLRGKFVKIILYVFAYALVHFYILVHSIYHRKLFLKVTGLLMVFSSFGYRWFTSDGFDAEDHSQANFTLCIMMLIFFSVIFFWWFFALKSWKSNNVRIKYGYFIFWLTFWLLVYDFRVRRSCRHLQDSLDYRMEYNNKGLECRWEHGKICWHYTIDGIFRPLYWGRSDCTKIPTDLEEHRAM